VEDTLGWEKRSVGVLEEHLEDERRVKNGKRTISELSSQTLPGRRKGKENLPDDKQN